MLPSQPENLLSDLIRINTVNPPGNETAGAEYLKDLFDRAGVASEIIEPEKGRGSLIARMGSGPKKILLVSHLDVVPAGEGWSFDPLCGDIKNGMVYGRGALDCKDLMAAQVYAMLQLSQANTLPDGEIILAATADEEAGGKLGVNYLLNNYPEKLRADFAVNEGAEFPIHIRGNSGNTFVCFIQVGEKGTAWNKVTAKGVSCHGSIPTLGDNAIARMTKAISAFQKYRPQINLIPEVKFLLEELARLKGITPDKAILDEDEPDNETLIRRVDELLEQLELEKGFGEILRAMTRMTISPNVISGGTKTNTVPHHCETEVDVRILPGQDRDYVLRELHDHMGENLDIEFSMYREPSFSSSSTPYYSLIKETTQEVLGNDVVCLPHISTGSTDSHYLRNAGIPSYGIGMAHRGANPDMWKAIHGQDEKIDVESVRLKADFIAALIRNYLK